MDHPFEALLGIVGAVGFFGLLAYLGHRDKRRRPMHDRPGEIDAEPLRDYRGPGRKGEPFFQVGGLAFIGSIVASAIVAYLLSPYVHAIADWLAPVTRSPR